jgi:hypothetical protein
MYDDLEIIGEEVIVAYCKSVLRHSTVRNEGKRDAKTKTKSRT